MIQTLVFLGGIACRQAGCVTPARPRLRRGCHGLKTLSL